LRVGIGYDVHRLVSGKALVLGGVAVEFDRGLEGHSDADVLVHAVCDAMLGAAGAGDIGEHFPDTDPAWKGISSLVLLSKTAALVKGRGFAVESIDATVIAQAPRISPYKATMAANVARAAGIAVDRVNVKATSTEGLGWIGRGEGIGAMAVALLTPLDISADSF
jgi:2-C-methyl-D-erythritol 2,4-cyclodiphosphate synthase